MRIAEIFHSIQGEGSLVGMPSVFVRTSGCNLRCSWCDTPYTSWRPEGDDWTVERILAELAQQAAQPAEAGGANGNRVEGLLAAPPPSASLIPGFGNSTLDFTLGVQVRRFVDQYAVQSELRKRILERFQKEGIEMPFPTETILLEKPEKDGKQ